MAAACASPPPPAKGSTRRDAASPTTSTIAETITEPTPEPSTEPDPKPEPPPTPPDAGQLVALDVQGHRDAVVAVPRRADPGRPLLVATHGNYDGPAWQCREWQRIAGDEIFVLCPRGEPRPDSPSADDTRFTYASNAALERELDAALSPGLGHTYGGPMTELARAELPWLVADDPRWSR